MTEPSSSPRTFDRAEVESILLEAARLDESRGAEHRSVALARTGDDALTLGDIERAAAEAGISRGAVSAASLRVALRAAHAAAPRAHVVHEIAGSLSAEALESDCRRGTDPGAVVARADSRRTASRWRWARRTASPDPSSRRSDPEAAARRCRCGAPRPYRAAPTSPPLAMLGAPVFVFPAVAVSGGVWPALASVLALAAGGVVTGAGLGVAASRLRVTRWQERITEAVMAIASSVEGQTRTDP